MAVETLSCLPGSLIAGDTLRFTHANSKYPSSDWSLRVAFVGPVTKTVNADANDDDNGFTVVVSGVASAALLAGPYVVSFIFTADDDERATDPTKYYLTVLGDATKSPKKSIARQTLEAMEAALLNLGSETNAQVNFNGESFTSRNLSDLQKAIEHQRGLVAIEERRQTGRSRVRRILAKA
jgi:hypothetical protein